MDFDKFKKLEKKVKRQKFSIAYSGINKWSLIFSIFGNCASIFFAYFLIFSLLEEAMPQLENKLIISIVTIVFLLMFEMLKRYVFNKFSLEHIRAKFKLFTKEVIILALFSVSMIVGSFYFSLNGAQKFTNQDEYIENVENGEFKNYSDSLNTYYGEKILVLEDKNTVLVEENNTLTEQNIQINKEAEDINSYSTKRAKYKLIEQNNERIDKNNDKIDKNDEKISSLETERDEKINLKKEELALESQEDVLKSESNSTKFIILSTFIELIILFGIYFNCYYDYRSVIEYDEMIKKNPRYQKWIDYDRILDMIYNNGSSMAIVGDEVISISKIEDLSRINNYLKIDRKAITDCFKVLVHLEILMSKGNKKLIEVDYEIAKEVLKAYFKID